MNLQTGISTSLLNGRNAAIGTQRPSSAGMSFQNQSTPVAPAPKFSGSTPSGFPGSTLATWTLVLSELINNLVGVPPKAQDLPPQNAIALETHVESSAGEIAERSSRIMRTAPPAEMLAAQRAASPVINMGNEAGTNMAIKLMNWLPRLRNNDTSLLLARNNITREECQSAYPIPSWASAGIYDATMNRNVHNFKLDLGYASFDMKWENTTNNRTKLTVLKKYDDKGKNTLTEADVRSIQSTMNLYVNNDNGYNSQTQQPEGTVWFVQYHDNSISCSLG